MQVVARKPHIGYAFSTHLGRSCMVWRLMQPAQRVGFYLWEMSLMTDKKRCTKCGCVKPLGEFSKDKRRSDGRHAQCKACRNAYSAQYRAGGGLKKQDYGDRYKGRYSSKSTGWWRAWIVKNVGSRRAHKTVAAAVKAGKLPKVTDQVCAQCGKRATGYHHTHGYSKENKLRVIPLCDKCHRTLHAQLRHHEEKKSAT